MARAGFYTVQNSHIRFGRDGIWYADGEPIANQRIADLFSRHIRRAADGTYVLEMAFERAPVEVDDTPYVVRALDVSGNAIDVELNDGTRERLDPATLAVGERDVLYCRVKKGAEPARFLRAAYYQMVPHVSEDSPGRFALQLGGTRHPIGRL
jgi:uncharacterized protein